jgi:hypothetical protein
MASTLFSDSDAGRRRFRAGLALIDAVIVEAVTVSLMASHESLSVA